MKLWIGIVAALLIETQAHAQTDTTSAKMYSRARGDELRADQVPASAARAALALAQHRAAGGVGRAGVPGGDQRSCAWALRDLAAGRDRDLFFRRRPVAPAGLIVLVTV